MNIRRYRKGDIPLLVKLLKPALAEYHYKAITYNDQKINDLLVGNIFNKEFFLDVVIEDGGIVGAMGGSIIAFPFSYEVYSVDTIIYILPKSRKLRTITALVKSYIKWALSQGVSQIRLCQSSGYKVDKFRVFAKRMGFTEIGSHHNMEISI